VALAESGFDPYAIGVNGPKPARLTFTKTSTAAAAARRLISEGRNIDLGLGQINSRNLAGLGLTVDAAFDPCRNLAASAQVLVGDYQRSAPTAGREQDSLRTALSYYNTGRPDRGFANGYVAKVVAAADHIVPALTGAAARPSPAPTREPTERPAWAVFGGPSATPFVLSPTLGVSQ
jgi:type IV secretion system protein VirB1